MQRFIQKRNVGFLTILSESIKRQVKENKDFQKNVQLLGEGANKVASSSTVKQAQEAAKKTSQATNAVINAVGGAVEKTLQQPIVKATGQAIYHSAQVVGTVTQKVADPILDTKVAKSMKGGIKEVLDSSDNAFYNEYISKEERQKQKEEYMKKKKVVRQGPDGLPIIEGPVQADANAGQGIVMHQSSKIAEAWRKFKEESEIGQRMFGYSRAIEESSNPIMETFRNVSASTKLDETEKAKAIRLIRDFEPNFSQHLFLKEATKFIVPDLIESWLASDAKILKLWCGEKAMARLEAEMEYQKKNDLIPDSKLLDIHDVSIQKMEILDDTLPIIVISCRTDEVLMFKNKKGEIVVGSDDTISRSTYLFVFTKQQIAEPEREFNPETNGWMVIDIHRYTSQI